MIKNKCYVCGCFSFRADRALSGRLVCTACGNPYGVRKKTNYKLKKIDIFYFDKRKLFYCLLFTVIFMLIVI